MIVAVATEISYPILCVICVELCIHLGSDYTKKKNTNEYPLNPYKCK